MKRVCSDEILKRNDASYFYRVTERRSEICTAKIVEQN